ncbi:hypothetical protein Tco_1033649 [Tanacetum coccineum]
MARSITRFDIKKLDGNMLGSNKLVPGFEIEIHGVQIDKRVCFEVKLHGAQGDRAAEDKHGLLGKRAGKGTPWHKGGADITVTGVPGQEGLEGNIVGRKKRRSKEAKLENLLKYKKLRKLLITRPG